MRYDCVIVIDAWSLKQFYAITLSYKSSSPWTTAAPLAKSDSGMDSNTARFSSLFSSPSSPLHSTPSRCYGTLKANSGGKLRTLRRAADFLDIVMRPIDRLIFCAARCLWQLSWHRCIKCPFAPELRDLGRIALTHLTAESSDADAKNGKGSLFEKLKMSYASSALKSTTSKRFQV